MKCVKNSVSSCFRDCAIVSCGIYVERKTQFSIELKNLAVSQDAVARSSTGNGRCARDRSQMRQSHKPLPPSRLRAALLMLSFIDNMFFQ